MRDATVVPDYEGFDRAVEEVGEYGLVIPRAADPPVLELWRRWTGLDRFSYDWYDCRAEVRRALDAMAERNEAIFEAVAGAPSEFCCSGGNLTADVVGPALFREEVLPHFEAEAKVMRAAGKRTVNHMDGPLQPLLDCIADAPVDVVEAFAPFPDGDTTVAEARKAWPDKALSINFPSAVHLQPPDQVKAELFSILEQAAPGAGFVVGITENVPASVQDDSIRAIVEGLVERGACPVMA
jgi:uroporphyrinogen decarboxylase